MSASSQNHQLPGNWPPALPTPIKIQYAFLHTEMETESTKGYEFGNDFWLICSKPLANPDTGIFPCTARFFWRDFEMDVVVTYDPRTATVSNFRRVKGTRKGGLEKARKIEIKMSESDVKDDNGNPFLLVSIEFGSNGYVCEDIELVGKKVIGGKEVKEDAKLSRVELERLGLLDEEEMDRRLLMEDWFIKAIYASDGDGEGEGEDY
ncbi:hypothetical protein P7C71_g6286, partial [Lecanoromycetidae sp. Uapishka_2]